jgi:hypothetical protein
VKVLDFGLAKAAVGEAGRADLSQMPTATHEGVILGRMGMKGVLSTLSIAFDPDAHQIGAGQNVVASASI